MKKIWDTLGAVIITVLVVFMLIQLIRPYMLLLIISGIIVVVGGFVYKRLQRW